LASWVPEACGVREGERESEGESESERESERERERERERETALFLVMEAIQHHFPVQ
jgi:hypothetical protein